MTLPFWPPPSGLRISPVPGSLDIGHFLKLGFQCPQPLFSALTHHVLQTHRCDCSGLESIVYAKLPLWSTHLPTHPFTFLQNPSLILPPGSLPRCLGQVRCPVVGLFLPGFCHDWVSVWLPMMPGRFWHQRNRSPLSHEF